MSRMKTFGKYLILFLAFYIFVNFMSYELVKSTYVDIEYNIQPNDLEIIIEEAKAARESGKIKGKVKNNTAETLQNKYIKIDFVSESGNIITSKYVDIKGLKAGEEKEINLRFKAENIKSLNINVVENVENKNAQIISADVVNALGLGFIIWLIVWPF